MTSAPSPLIALKRLKSWNSKPALIKNAASFVASLIRLDGISSYVAKFNMPVQTRRNSIYWVGIMSWIKSKRNSNHTYLNQRQLS